MVFFNNNMTKLKTKLYHLKVWWFGDKELENNGKFIPCKKCDKMFKSYMHYGTDCYVYDSICEKCEK